MSKVSIRVPTPEENAWAEVAETAAMALAEYRNDDCFGPLRDDNEHRVMRGRYRAEARAVLAAVNHRGHRDELAKVDAALREHGFEYPVGARGVADALGMRASLVEDMKDPSFLRERLAWAEANQ